MILCINHLFLAEIRIQIIISIRNYKLSIYYIEFVSNDWFFSFFPKDLDLNTWDYLFATKPRDYQMHLPPARV